MAHFRPRLCHAFGMNNIDLELERMGEWDSVYKMACCAFWLIYLAGYLTDSESRQDELYFDTKYVDKILIFHRFVLARIPVKMANGKDV